ncbi:MAG: hypothetical protein ACTTKS_03235 [Bulleidia sp.]
MKSQIIRTRNIPPSTDGRMLHIRVKPTGLLILGLTLGIASLFGARRFIILGVLLGSVCLFSFFLPDRILASFTPEFLALYNQKEKDSAIICYWDEIVQWRYEYHRANDCLVVTLVDGSSQSVEMYARYPLVWYMHRFAPNKEIRSGRMKGDIK